MSMKIKNKNAIVLTDGILAEPYAKTAHGLIRYSSRFQIKAILDRFHDGVDAGDQLDGINRRIPVTGSLDSILEQFTIHWAIVGIAPVGGKMTPTLKRDIIECINHGISIVSGLHDYAGYDPDIAASAEQSGVDILDIRKPKLPEKLHGFTGKIASLTIPRIAVLGMDCAIGKRTTARIITQALCRKGLKTEMIYTGQTGWLQGGDYGFILDATLNDFVSGELEHQILTCAKKEEPDLIIIEGQSGLRSPYGPCGAEFIVSGGAKGVILQIDPSRQYFDGLEKFKLKIGSVKDEVAIIRLLGAEVIAVSINSSNLSDTELEITKVRLSKELGIPVIALFKDDEKMILKPIFHFLEKQK